MLAGPSRALSFPTRPGARSGSSPSSWDITSIASSHCRRKNLAWRQPLMVQTIVDGSFRQTNLNNESSEYLAKRSSAPRRSAVGQRALLLTANSG